MTIVDVGSGQPIVLVPGIQGRWEWMKTAVDALSRTCRVITFSLADEPAAETRRGQSGIVPTYVGQIEEAMDASGIRRATICGVSYGGLIAAAFAAEHPDRVSALILVSALPPGWRPNRRVRFYAAAPRLLTPLFMLASLRLYPEIAAANETFAKGVGAAVGHALNVLRHMFSPTSMARRAVRVAAVDLRDEVARVTTPALVITGEEGLDRVVAPSQTREYLAMWPHARAAVLANTGHLGLITKPDEFARLVTAFLEEVPESREAAGGAPSRERRMSRVPDVGSRAS